jgi:hypothetical protein
MKNNDQIKTDGQTKDRKYTLLNIIIVVLTIIFFCLCLFIAADTKPRGYVYGPDSAETMLRLVQYGKYSELLRSSHINRMLGVNTSGNDAYTIPYAAADYYEAAFNYKALMSADVPEEASTYSNKMSAAKQTLGEYAYIADDIDDLLKL